MCQLDQNVKSISKAIREVLSKNYNPFFDFPTDPIQKYMFHDLFLYKPKTICFWIYKSKTYNSKAPIVIHDETIERKKVEIFHEW